MRLPPICCLCSSTRASHGAVVCTGCALIHFRRKPLIIRRSVRAVA